MELCMDFTETHRYMHVTTTQPRALLRRIHACMSVHVQCCSCDRNRAVVVLHTLHVLHTDISCGHSAGSVRASVDVEKKSWHAY